MKDGRRAGNRSRASGGLRELYARLRNKGGHSSVPDRPDNASDHLADGAGRLFYIPLSVKLKRDTRAYFERTAAIRGASRRGRHANACVGQTGSAARCLPARWQFRSTTHKLRTHLRRDQRFTRADMWVGGFWVVNALPQLAERQGTIAGSCGEVRRRGQGDAWSGCVLADDQIIVSQPRARYDAHRPRCMRDQWIDRELSQAVSFRLPAPSCCRP